MSFNEQLRSSKSCHQSFTHAYMEICVFSFPRYAPNPTFALNTYIIGRGKWHTPSGCVCMWAEAPEKKAFCISGLLLGTDEWSHALNTPQWCQSKGQVRVLLLEYVTSVCTSKENKEVFVAITTVSNADRHHTCRQTSTPAPTLK